MHGEPMHHSFSMNKRLKKSKQDTPVRECKSPYCANHIDVGETECWVCQRLPVAFDARDDLLDQL